MIITIWRHGEAGRAATDRQRELTGRGTDDVGYGCHHLHDILQARSRPHPDLVLYSAWVRAAQTADIVATAFTHAALQPLQALTPAGTIGAVDSALAPLAEEDGPGHVVLVSHQPLVSLLVEHYLGEWGRVPALPPGGLVTLEMEVPCKAAGRLLWWAFPPEFEANA